MNIFPIYQPNGYKYDLLYENGASVERKIEILEDTVLTYWEDYIIKNWIYWGKIGPMINTEDKVKSFLDNCGTFLVRSNMKESNIISKHMNEQIKEHEIPESAYLNNENSFDNELAEIMESNTPKNTKAKKSKNVKYFDKHIKTKNKNKEHLKNLLIPNTPYHDDFVIVDTDGEFEVDGLRFRISKSAPQYSFKRAKNKEKYYDMTHVGYYRQNNTYIFFDMNFENITEHIIIEDGEV